MLAWRGPLAWAYAQAGRLEEARAELALLRKDRFAVLPRDVNFDVGLAILAHVADELGDAELAARDRAAAAAARGPVDRVRHRRRRRSGRWPTRSASATCWPVASTWRSATSRLAIAKCRTHARAARTRRTPRCGWRGRSSGGARRGDAERAVELEATAVAIAHELDMPRLLRDSQR